MLEIIVASLDEAREFYGRYSHPGPEPEETVFLAKEDGESIGVVRLCPDDGFCVLRTMRVADSHQRRGIGTLLLKALEQAIPNQPCFCIAYAHLEAYYGQIGFVTITDDLAPDILRERQQTHRQKGFNTILMRRLPRL